MEVKHHRGNAIRSLVPVVFLCLALSVFGFLKRDGYLDENEIRVPERVNENWVQFSWNWGQTRKFHSVSVLITIATLVCCDDTSN